MAKTKDKKRNKDKVEYRAGEGTVSKVEEATDWPAVARDLTSGDEARIAKHLPPEVQSDYALLGGDAIPTFSLADLLGNDGMVIPVTARISRKAVKLSRIRVQLNRRLSEAEVEDITHRGIQFGLSVSKDRQHLYANGAMNSRQLFPIVAKVLAENYVNLLPRAVRTFSEYNGHIGR